MTAYKCFKSDFEALEKRINHITKKLDKYGIKWTFKKLDETIEIVNVYDYDTINHCKIKIDTIPVEVIHYTFTMDNLKLGQYTPIAVLEHGEDGNMIHIIKDDAIIPTEYRTAKSICEHCNSDRQRNKTVLLQDVNGNIKQVGTTCIKEYTGIDAQDIISIYADIHDIFLNDTDYIDSNTASSMPKFCDTIDYLTACIQLINQYGYIKDGTRTTKYIAWDIAQDGQQDSKHKATAQQVIDYFKSKEFDDNFYNNIKIALQQEYTKTSGFVAYAYMAYQKNVEYDKQKAEQNQQKALSQYIGNIGDKIQTELRLINRYSYETSYNGYNTMIQYIYVFEDNKGNQYKWNTSKFLEKNVDEKLTIKGTIKAHEEYKEQKQTVLTRCKVI